MTRFHALALWISLASILCAGSAQAQDAKESKVLETTTIEGQILFPKVLFISAEDQARYPEMLHRTYLRTALELVHSAPMPKTICATEPGDAHSASAPSDPANEHPTNSKEVNP